MYPRADDLRFIMTLVRSLGAGYCARMRICNVDKGCDYRSGQCPTLMDTVLGDSSLAPSSASGRSSRRRGRVPYGS